MVKRLLKRKKRYHKKKSSNLLVGLILGTIILFILVVWRVYVPGTNILGVTINPTVGVDKVVPILPTASQQQIILPTNSPVPPSTPIPQPTLAEPTVLPTMPPVFILNLTPTPGLDMPQPTGVIIYRDEVTVPIDAYKTSAVTTEKTQTTSSQAVSTIGQTINTSPVAETQPNTGGTNLRSEPLIVETINSAGSNTGSVTITSSNTPVTFENSEAELTMKLTDKNGVTKELASSTFEKIAERLSQDNIRVYAAGENGMLIKEAAVGAVTSFPISVDSQNHFFADTPIGRKEISILPADASELADHLHLLTMINGNATNNRDIRQIIRLVLYNNTLAYEFKGSQTQFFFAIFPFPGGIQKTVYMSVAPEDHFNRILHTHESPFYRVIDALSVG